MKMRPYAPMVTQNFIKTILQILLAVTLSLSLPGTALAEDKQRTKPNIIYILADDAGYGDFGAYGQKEINTPEIDRMAKEGVVFTNHYAGSTVCAPSRASLLTGKHTGHAPIRGNSEILPEGQRALPADAVTMAEVLKKAGLTTGIIGKWGLGGPGSEGEPNLQGFDYWYGYLCQRQAHNHYPSHLWNNGEKIELDGNQYTHDLFTTEALNFIKRNKGTPFFLYLPYAVPHARLQIPDLGLYEDKAWPESKKRLAAMISRMDRDIGRILDLLKELNIAEHTLVLFSSDNGPHAEGGAKPEFFNSAGPFRGKKRDLYEGGIRVPLVGWWPGKIRQGTSSAHISAFWDMLPTFAELAHAEVPGDIDGLSIVPSLLGKKGQKKHKYLYWEFHEQGGKQAVRLGKWKAVKLDLRLNPDAPLELYNLENDIGERQNVADANPEIVAKIQSILLEARTVSPAFPLIGKMVYRLDIYNAWMFSAVFLLSILVPFLFGRRKNKKELIEFFVCCGMKEKAIVGVSAAYGLFLFGFSAYLPLWGATKWFDYGLILSILGVVGYGITSLHFNFRKPSSLMTGGLYRLSRNPGSIFSYIFWTGVGMATFSRLLILLLLLYALLRHFVILIEEKFCEKKYGEPYILYKKRRSRYFLFL